MNGGSETPSTKREHDARAVELLRAGLLHDGFAELLGSKQPILGENGRAIIVFLGLIVPVIATAWWQAGWWAGLVALIGCLFVLTVGGNSDFAMTLGLSALLGLWVVSGAAQAVSSGWLALGVSHGLVLALLSTVSFFRLDFPSLARSLPMLAPLSLLVLLIPVLTAEVWEAAAAMASGQLFFFGFLVVLPALLVLYQRLKGMVLPAYGEITQRLADDEASFLLYQRLTKATSEPDARWFVDTALPNLRERLSPEAGVGLAFFIANSLQNTFARTLARRLLPTSAAIGLAATAYLYLLSVAAVPRQVAEKWSGESVPMARIDLLVEVSLPLGSYLELAAFLGIAATAIFLALVITDQRYTVALTDALLHQPAYRSVVLGIPYLVILFTEQGYDLRSPDFVPPTDLVQRTAKATTGIEPV
jgi:hypothetical protein